MDDQKVEYASLSLTFLETISKESKSLSERASMLLEEESKVPMISALQNELITMQMAFFSLNYFCVEAIETCHITDDKIVEVPSQHFLKIADASQIGVQAYTEAQKYISFSYH